MYAYKDISDTIHGHYCCDVAEMNRGLLMDCEHCPYHLEDSGDFCVDKLNNDIQYYLNKAKALMEPTQSEQPPLPGIFEEKMDDIAYKLKMMDQETRHDE